MAPEIWPVKRKDKLNVWNHWYCQKTGSPPAIYDALTILQHRGQDAAGIATLEGHRIHLYKGNGLVRDVFPPSELKKN